MDDLISRRAAIKALWLALYEYEDKCEKQFLESKELDVAEWFQHSIFVQNMSDIDRQTILNLPSADAVPVVRCKDCKLWGKCSTVPDWFCADGERKTDEDLRKL